MKKYQFLVTCYLGTEEEFVEATASNGAVLGVYHSFMDLIDDVRGDKFPEVPNLKNVKK